MTIFVKTILNKVSEPKDKPHFAAVLALQEAIHECDQVLSELFVLKMHLTGLNPFEKDTKEESKSS